MLTQNNKNLTITISYHNLDAFGDPNLLNLNSIMDDQDRLKTPILSLVLVIQAFIIVVGILDNSLLIFLVLSSLKLRNVRNAFILNLTISNLLLITICIPSFVFSIVFKNWILGNFWCKFIHSMQIVVILVSAFSIMLIAIDRWMFVVLARSRQLNKRDVILIIMVIWLLAITLSAPTFIHRTTKQLYDDLILKKLKEFAKFKPIGAGFNETDSFLLDTTRNIYKYDDIDLSYKPETGDEHMINEFSDRNPIYCVDNWSIVTHKRIYICILFFLEFLLPCLSMLVTYIWIIRFLKAQDDRMDHYDMLKKRLLQKEKRHQKNCKLLSALCLTFIVCCLPLSLFNIKAEFSMSVMSVSEKEDLYMQLIVLTIMEEFNTLITPLLYGWMNHNFRVEVDKKLNHVRKRWVSIHNVKTMNINNKRVATCTLR